MFTLHMAVLFVPYLFSSLLDITVVCFTGLQMLYALGRLALVIFLATCVTSDDPALYTCQPGTTPQGVTPAPNRETMFLIFLHIIPIFIYIFFYRYFVMPTRIHFLFLTFNSPCKPKWSKIFIFVEVFFFKFIERNTRTRASYKRRPKKTIICRIFFPSLLESFFEYNVF